MAKGILVVCDEKAPSVSLQQIPAEFKDCFPAKEGHSFIGLDASQMEVRMLASLSHDENMMAVANSGRDIYKEMAAMVYGVNYDDVTPELRSRVKTCTIALQYGMRDASLARRLKITEQEAAEVRAKYYAAFPKAIAFRNRCLDYSMKTGKSPTFFGRYRDFGGPQNMDEQKANEAFSTLIQGSAAEIHKVCLVMLNKHFKEKGYGEIMLTLHDEALVQVPDDKVEEASRELKELMMKSSKLREDWCTFDYSVHSGKTWHEASKD